MQLVLVLMLMKQLFNQLPLVVMEVILIQIFLIILQGLENTLKGINLKYWQILLIACKTPGMIYLLAGYKLKCSFKYLIIIQAT